MKRRPRSFAGRTEEFALYTDCALGGSNPALDPFELLENDRVETGKIGHAYRALVVRRWDHLYDAPIARAKPEDVRGGAGTGVLSLAVESTTFVSDKVAGKFGRPPNWLTTASLLGRPHPASAVDGLLQLRSGAELRRRLRGNLN